MVIEAAARFVFRCSAGGEGSVAHPGFRRLTTKHRFTLRTRWHSLPTPIEAQELLAGLVDPWNCPVWTLEVESGTEEPQVGCSAGVRALGGACVAYALEYEQQHGSLQGAALVGGSHQRVGDATAQALQRRQQRGGQSAEEVGAGLLLQAVGGLMGAQSDEISPEEMAAVLRWTFNETGSLRGGGILKLVCFF